MNSKETRFYKFFVISHSPFFILWVLSVSLGPVLTTLGLALFSKLEKPKFVIFVGGALILLPWLGVWHQSILYPVLYGIGGGVILL